MEKSQSHTNFSMAFYFREENMEETGLKKLMKDLGVKDFKELNEYINNPLHREEAIVIEFKKFLEYLKNKGE